MKVFIRELLENPNNSVIQEDKLIKLLNLSPVKKLRIEFYNDRVISALLHLLQSGNQVFQIITTQILFNLLNNTSNENIFSTLSNDQSIKLLEEFLEVISTSKSKSLEEFSLDSLSNILSFHPNLLSLADETTLDKLKILSQHHNIYVSDYAKNIPIFSNLCYTICSNPDYSYQIITKNERLISRNNFLLDGGTQNNFYSSLQSFLFIVSIIFLLVLKRKLDKYSKSVS